MNLIPAMQARGQGQCDQCVHHGRGRAPRRASPPTWAPNRALEGWTLAAQNELVHTGVEFTLMNYPLVRTPMIAPTAIYRYVPAMSEERAVDWLCEAIVTRPKRKVPAFGLASQVMYQVLPKTSELIVNTSFQLAARQAALTRERAKKAPPKRGRRPGDPEAYAAGRDAPKP